MPRYVRVHTLEDALAHLVAGPFRVIAGGTDVFPALVDGAPMREAMLDISGITALRGIGFDEEASAWRLGALTTWADVQRARMVPPWFATLRRAAREVGGVQIQAVGTVAGNLCNASPAADGVVPLLALDARVEIAGPRGVRVEPLASFITGVRRTTRTPDELVTGILVPEPGRPGVSDFLKLGARHSLVISIAMVAVVLWQDSDGAVGEAAVAVGACSPVAVRLTDLEARLVGLRPGVDDLAAQVREADGDALSPIDDVRATAAYRREAALVLIRRALTRCAEVWP
ncbi:xanthine dehydrogenase family protein subunit M [Roseospira marina]|uniref:Xanthine dehydrogenase family protein subunit M n=1 Tax=Roseospira marina TaxID=140057 RepID=A0A5M6I8X0_9PROT|nr:FAD binding domain-containing protein [Roseospira marina]KAA5604631.1 xanthine dehydrogenase family protein subunit M [Roseospira marina]MBB4315073.1 CO/xanthine dehydrogenase FAD-binding subunit [Roseospira marina]MBB5088157.1 CO/xanthine dehydrogenase FAD-binding subunit [Roseospira marina]